MTRHVAIYARISQDKRGRREGVDAQERWGRDYAADAWPGLPVEVFADNDLSAADPDVHRPEFERLRDWITRGQVAHLWSVEQYRVVRQEVEWFTFAAELDAAGISELHTNRDGVVAVRDEIAGIKAVLGAAEVRKLKQRVNDRLAENAAQGLPPGGGPRFGYRRALDDDGNKTFQIVPEQAAIIRECAERVLDGWGMNSIVTDLTRRGVRGPQGGALTVTSVRSWLQSPTVAGHRVHQGRIVGAGNWEPILDESTWQACRARLAQPRRVRHTNGNSSTITGRFYGGTGSARRYWITGGLSVCAVCQAPLRATRRTLRGTSIPYLVCDQSHVGIRLDQAQDHVLAVLFAELDKPEFLDQLAVDEQQQHRDELTTQLTNVEDRRAQLAETWATGHLSVSEWHTARRALADHEQTLRAELANLPVPTMTRDITAARDAWPSMTLEEQREFVRMFLERVTIHRSGGAKRFDPNRVEITWRYT